MFAFADDHEVHATFKPSESPKFFNILESAMSSIHDWICKSRLKMNPDKTEFMLFASRKNIKKVESTKITVLQEDIHSIPCTKYLGAFMDQHLSFNTHVLKKCATASWNLAKIKRIRKFLTRDSLQIIMNAMVMSHLDYANGLLFNTTQNNIHKLQMIQNKAAKITLGRSSRSSSTNCLIDLHWLPIKARIDFKIILLTHKSLKKESPMYLQELLNKARNTNTRNSCKINQLLVPRIEKETFKKRAFCYASPTLWNSLPDNIRIITDTNKFKQALKTFLFKKYLINVTENDFIYY